jgi:hypothetical protein
MLGSLATENHYHLVFEQCNFSFQLLTETLFLRYQQIYCTMHIPYEIISVRRSGLSHFGTVIISLPHSQPNA